MRRVVQRGRGVFEVEEKPTPKPGPGEILIKIAYCGICGSDLHFFDIENAPSGNVLGHEWSGTIAQAGPGVEALKVGDHVSMGGIPKSMVPEGLVLKPDFSNMFEMHPVAHAGGYSDYLLYEAGAVLKVPDGVSLKEAALSDTLGIGIMAVHKTKVKIGSSVLIIGAGPIGLTTLLSVRLAGAGQVVVTEMVEKRKQMALSMGADLILDPTEVNIEGEVLKLTGGLGFDIVMESAGVPTTIQQAVNTVKRSGMVGMVGVSFKTAEINPGAWYAKDVTATVIPGGDLVTALKVIARKQIDVNPLISGVVGLDDLQESFEGLLKPNDQLKVLVAPNDNSL